MHSDMLMAAGRGEPPQTERRAQGETDRNALDKIKPATSGKATAIEAGVRSEHTCDICQNRDGSGY